MVSPDSSAVPGATACAVGGDSWIYQFDYRTGSFVKGSPGDLVARKQTGALTVGMVSKFSITCRRSLSSAAI